MAQINIPNLSELYEDVKNYIKENQGEKGYIDTQDKDCDPITAIVYNSITWNYLTEYYVKGVRVNEDDDIEIIYDLQNVSYDDEAFTSDDGEIADWREIRYSDIILFVPTLFSIAESIEEYE